MHKLHKSLDFFPQITYYSYVKQMRLMAQKFLYLIDFWVPFPTSEYSGLLAVIGESDNEVHDILVEYRDEYLDKYDNLIMKNVVDAQKFVLAENEESRVVEAFTT